MKKAKDLCPACLGRAVLMVWVILPVCLALPCRAAGPLPVYRWELIDQDRYIYPSDEQLEQLDWREIRKRREAYRTAGLSPRQFSLKALPIEILGIPAGGSHSPAGTPWPAVPPAPRGEAAVFIRDPDGIIKPLGQLPPGDGEISLPRDLNLIGRYLLGGVLDLGETDVDGDGILETVYMNAKYLVSHRKNKGRMGKTSVVFFDDAQTLPLEIGPVINTAKSRYGGGRQRPHREYEMAVKYRGAPVAGANVTVIAEGSGWHKAFVTDEDGRFKVTPADDRVVDREWQNYLYIATVFDRQRHTFHVATLPVTVSKNRPEWRSKAMGFTLWAVAGSAILLLTVFAGIGHARKLAQKELLIFSRDTINPDDKKGGPKC